MITKDMINSLVFRKYDIRGDATQYISPDLAYKIGFCFAKMHIKKPLEILNSTKHYSQIELNFRNISLAKLLDAKLPNIICVSRDGRLSSAALFDALCKGLTAGGAIVVSIGISPSPILYFADKKINPIASIMITASHNHKNDNGFKFISCGKPFYGKNIEQLYDMLNINNTETNINKASILILDMNDEYITQILENIYINPEIKVAWDPGHGAACTIVNKLQQRLINHNIMINSELDGNFPNRSPDPSNPDGLIAKVKEYNCDIGFALDGDADRLVVVTNDGQILSGEQLLYLFAKDILKSRPNNKVIIGDVKMSQAVYDQIAVLGGEAIMCKTGHPYIKEKMHITGAVLAVEASGHIFFADKYLGYDDGIYSALRFIELISKQAISIPKFNIGEIKIKIDDTKKFIFIDKIKQHLQSQNIQINDIDGIRVNEKDKWWLIRASNTEALIILRYGTSDSSALPNLKHELEVFLQKFI